MESEPATNRLSRAIFRFNLRRLLILVAVAAAGMWIITQAGMKTAYVEVVQSTLRTDANGMVRGQLAWRLAEPLNSGPHSGTTRYSDFLCSITNLDQPELLKVEPGERFKVRYRAVQIGLLPVQDKFKLFLVGKLNIAEQHIIGYTILKDYTEVVITGDGRQN